MQEELCGIIGEVMRYAAESMHKLEEVEIQCPYCGETIGISVDCSVEEQSYIEDCQVCCQPNVLTVRWDSSAGEFVISAELES